MHNITDFWKAKVLAIATTPCPRPFIQERKFLQAQTLEIPGDSWREGHDFTLEGMGYRGGKIAQLKRNYWNEENLIEAYNKFHERIEAGNDVTSVSAILQNHRKSSKSQGFCMQSIVLTYFKGNKSRPSEITVDIMYRSTEVIQKFSADLLFLHDELLPYLLEEKIELVSKVRFYFCNIFLSPLFLPVFYQFQDPVMFLKQIKLGDPSFHYKTLYRTKSPLEHAAGYYGYRSRNVMHKIFLQLLDQGKVCRATLENYISKELEEKGKGK